MNDNSNLNKQITHNEESPQSLGVIHTLIQEDKSENTGGKPALEPGDDFDTRSDNIVASQQMQTPRLEQQTISLSKRISTQRYDLKPDVYVESDEQRYFFMMTILNALLQNHTSLFILMFLMMITFPLSTLKIFQKTQRIIQINHR